MCFSAIGSFVLSGVLATAGAVSLLKSSGRPLRMFAGIPLVFAAQQAAEGVVWLTLDESRSTLHRLAVSLFLGMALVVWPIWSPLSLELAERNARQRFWLRALCWAGLVVALCASVLLARETPAARVAGHSIRYDFATVGAAPLHALSVLAYVIPTAVPWFVSTISLGRPLGVLLSLSLLASALIQRETLTSVWCFFAAVLSGLILLVVLRERRVRQGI
jgi:hypothetical protein